MKKFGLSSLMLMLFGSMAAYGENIWIEAETGAEYNPIVVKSDLGASDSIYLGSWKWGDYASRSFDNGVISYSVYVQQPGDYTLWARTRNDWDGIRPYDVSFGSGDVASASDWKTWAPDTLHRNWAWSNSGITQYLSAGSHTFHMVLREGGPSLHLDKLLLTNDINFVPGDTGLAESTIDIDNPYKSNTVEKYGQLRLVGNKLSDKNGAAIQLQGISAHGLQWFPLVDNQTIPYTAEFFGAEAVRLAMYIEDYAPTDPSDFWGGYMADKSTQLARTEQAINDAVNAGMYVLVDWHIHNTPSKYTAEATEFFKYISQKYGHLPNIIYEICNEPVAVSWSSGIKPYAQTIISTIRANDPDNIIIVGTPNWSQDVDAAAQDPLSGSNIMYAFHYYAATHDINQMKNKVQTALNAGLAIFVSEWGSSDVGTSSSNFEVAKQWMDFMNQNKLSWVNWSLGNKDEASSILKPTAPMSGPWVDADLTVAGQWLKPYFDAPQGSNGSGEVSTSSSVANISSVISVSSVASTSSVANSVAATVSSAASDSGSNANIIEGEAYSFVASGSVQLVGNALGYFDTGDHVAYNNIDLTNVTSMKITYGSGSGGNFELRADHAGGTKLLGYTAQNTGGYGNMTQVSVNLSATVSGMHTVYLVGTSGGGIMNLDKIELVKGTAPANSSSAPAASNFTIEAENFNQIPAGSVQSVGNALGYLDQGDHVAYYHIDMTGVKAIKLVYGSAGQGNVEFRVDSGYGPLVMSTYISNTGNYNTMRELTVNVSQQVSGYRNLYLVGTSGYGIMNLDKIILIK